MCCCVCISRRGMVYFGASIHIFVTLILFLGSSIRAYRISSYEREENGKHLLGATIIALYFLMLLVLGCLIFRGVEHKSPKVLGWSGGTFITLETFAFVFNLVLLSPMGGGYDEYGLRNFGFTVDVFQILLSLLFLGCMAGYCAVIILYILKLREDDTGSEYTYGEFDDAGTIPAPPGATNLSRSSTAHSNYSVNQNNKASSNQVTQTGSQGHLNQTNSNNHYAGSGNNLNHSLALLGTGSRKSPLLQDRRLQKDLGYYLPRFNPHAAAASTGAGEIQPPPTPIYTPHHRGSGTGTSLVPYRHSQTLPHPHHHHRNLTTLAEAEAALETARTQFPSSSSRMDMATLTQTLTRNSNTKRGVMGPSSGRISTDPRINPALLHHRTTTTVPVGSHHFEGDVMWEQPRVQALKYSYVGARKGIPGSTIGIEV